MANYVHISYELSIFRIIFWGSQDYLIDLAKYFWSLLNSPNLISQ